MVGKALALGDNRKRDLDGQDRVAIGPDNFTDPVTSNDCPRCRCLTPAYGQKGSFVAGRISQCTTSRSYP